MSRLKNQYLKNWLFTFSLYCFCFRESKMGEEERERGREGREICYYTYLCIHWLILTCALTGDQTCNLGELGGRFNQMSCTARALHTV